LGSGKKGARQIAYEVLRAVEDRDAFADRALDAALEKNAPLHDRDRALATELVYGTLRQRGLLDHVIGYHATLPVKQMDPEVLRILRLGAYQILFLDRIPDHASVSQSVELAKRYCPYKSPSFLNAVLRALCRNKNSPQAHSILQRPEQGQPRWLAELWSNELGNDLAQSLFRQIQLPPETILRVNLLRTSQEQLVHDMETEGYGLEQSSELSGALRVTQGGDVRRSKAHRMGACLQQDGASQLVTWILNPCPGHKVLDCCAAPGIKTSHIVEKMNDKGLVVAMDRHSARLADLAALCERMGATIVRPLCADAAVETGIPLKGIRFDRILADVPCSGLGILRRAPERKWRKAPDFRELSSLQHRILDSASRLLSSGGILVYSTCTVVRQENDAVIERFLSRRKDFVLEDASQGLPDAFRDLVCEKGMFRSWLRPHAFDFFFAARLRRL